MSSEDTHRRMFLLIKVGIFVVILVMRTDASQREVEREIVLLRGVWEGRFEEMEERDGKKELEK